MKKRGKELDFISFIKRDGSGTVIIPSEWSLMKPYPKVDDMSYCDDILFEINPLSLSEKTFIASGFNSFVVRLKEIKNEG